MDKSITIALIGMIGSALSAGLAALAVYFGQRNANTLKQVKSQVDGQLTEVVALKEAVSFAKGEDKQRDKQSIEGTR